MGERGVGSEAGRGWVKSRIEMGNGEEGLRGGGREVNAMEIWLLHTEP